MDEVKKTKKKQKVATPNNTTKKKKVVAKVKGDDLAGAEDFEEQKTAIDEEPKKEKRSWKGVIIFLAILVLLVAGGFVAKKILTKTTVVTETIKLPDDTRGVSNYFKEYLLDRVKIEKLFKYDYKELGSDAILKELADLKDGFSKVSRGVSGSYRTGEYKELAEVMEADASTCLAVVRELRSVMTASYSNKEERTSIFTKKAEEALNELRSALYVADVAFNGDVSGFSSKGILIFDGPVLIELGGGVMNVLLGDFEEKHVAVSTDKIGDSIKLIDGTGVFGYSSTKLIKLGDSLNNVLESGWLKYIEVDVGRTEVKMTNTKISTVLKNVWGMDEELKVQRINGLVSTEEKTLEDELDMVVKGLTGKL